LRSLIYNAHFVFYAPGALMGPALRKRLKERAGLTFSAR
jgi:hypothetical protein